MQFLLEMRHRLAERQIEEELDKADQVAAAAAAVAVEQILGGIDVEGRTRFLDVRDTARQTPGVSRYDKASSCGAANTPAAGCAV